MTTDALQKLFASLSLLGFYFSEPDSQSNRIVWRFSFALLENALASYHKNAELQRRIARMLAGDDALEKLQAAIFLSAIDEPRATAILKDLASDTTSVEVQQPSEFGSVSCQIRILAADFLGEKTINTNYWKVVNLANWATAVSLEKKSAGQTFDQDSLPKWEDVLDAENDASKRAGLLSKIEHLKNGGAAEKFFAAALLDRLDKAESRRVLQNLLDEKSEVTIFYGDIALPQPARRVAAEMLDPNNNERAASSGGDNKNLIARAFDWLGKTFG